MLIVALAVIAASTVTVVTLLGVIRSQQRSHARRVDALIDRLLHATGHTWTPPPAEQARRDANGSGDAKRVRVTASPEQYTGE